MASPQTPGGHQQVLPNVLAGFERTEAEVAARRQPLCRVEPRDLRTRWTLITVLTGRALKMRAAQPLFPLLQQFGNDLVLLNELRLQCLDFFLCSSFLPAEFAAFGLRSMSIGR